MNWVDILKICKNILGCDVMSEEVQSVCEFRCTLQNMKNHPQVEVWVFKSTTCFPKQLFACSTSFVKKIVKKNNQGCLTNQSSHDHHAWSAREFLWNQSMDKLPGLLIFNRKEVIVTENKTKVKAVSSCLIKHIFIVILFATADCAYKINRQQILKKNTY